MLNVKAILVAALTRADHAGVQHVRLEHFTAEELDVLLVRSHRDFLWPRSVLPSTARPGWRRLAAHSPELRRWWVQQAHLTEQDAQRLTSLQHAVHEELEERDWIERECGGPNAAIHVGPPAGDPGVTLSIRPADPGIGPREPRTTGPRQGAEPEPPASLLDAHTFWQPQAEWTRALSAAHFFGEDIGEVIRRALRAYAARAELERAASPVGTGPAEPPPTGRHGRAGTARPATGGR